MVVLSSVGFEMLVQVGCRSEELVAAREDAVALCRREVLNQVVDGVEAIYEHRSCG